MRHVILRRTASLLTILGMVLFTFPSALFAGTTSPFTVTLSREAASIAANQDIRFVTQTGLTSTQSLILTYTGFGSLTGASLAFSDIDLQQGSLTNCSNSNTWTDQTLRASGASSSEFNVTVAATTVTFASGGASALLTAGNCVRVLIGTNAAFQTTGVHQIVNGSAGTGTVAISGAGGFPDTGSAAVAFVTGTTDQVTISATVAPTLSFTNDNTGLNFGTLSTAQTTYANSTSGNGNTDTTANTLHVATNSATGYTLAYYGATLTCTTNGPCSTITPDTIPAATVTTTGITNIGSTGSSQFALSGLLTIGSVSGGAMVGLYDHAAVPSNWNFSASTSAAPVTLASASGSVGGTDAIDMHYGANVSASQHPGTYSTTITYLATGNF